MWNFPRRLDQKMKPEMSSANNPNTLKTVSMISSPGGKSVRLTGFTDKTPPKEPVAPAVEFQAHSANLGIHFYDGKQFPAEYRGDAFVAQHGSWNRTEPVGYQIMRVRFDGKGDPVGTEVFASGWLKDGNAVGRPVDIAELPDGSLIVSDDFADVVYRISYGK